MTEKRILLVDGHGIAFRAFYAVPELSARDGTPTNAVLGFCNMMIHAQKQLKPEEIFVAFDAKGPTFRHLLYPEYKATRKPTPEGFIIQMPLIQQTMACAGIRTMCRAGIEADDLLGSAAMQLSAQGMEVLVLTSDKDILQVVGPGVKVVRPGKGISSFTTVDEATFTAEFGFPPPRMVDYLSLMGDTVDNIPGVQGVGEKTAKTLLSHYASIEEVIAHADDLKPAQRRHILEDGQKALNNRKLTQLKCDEDLTEFLQEPVQANPKSLKALFSRLDINLKTADQLLAMAAPVSTPEPPVGDQAKTEDETILVLYPEPIDSVPLDTLLEAPRLALDVTAPCGFHQGCQDVSISLCSPTGYWWQGDAAKLMDELPRLLNRPVICADVKTLCSAMQKPQLGGLWDLKAAHYLLHPDQEKHDLATQTGVDKFSAERTMRLFHLKEELQHSIDESGMKDVLNNIDRPLIPVLVAMERRGIRLDKPAMAAVTAELQTNMDHVVERIDAAAGSKINLNSPKQLGELLFETLGLPVIKKTKNGYSTDVSVLEQLTQICGNRCEVPKLLLEYRELSKMMSGFAQPLMAAVTSDGLIHSTFEAQGTGTGRLSSRDPNMQNLPAYSGWGARVRSCLLPNHQGNCFVAADYSQIELRVLAHLCGDPQLLEIFRSNRDIHTETASMIFGLPASAVTKELRRIAKTVSFGLLYGMSAFGLAARLGVERNQAQEFMDAYFKAMPGVKDYVEKSYREAKDAGCSRTMFGRIRPLDEVETGSTSDKGHLKRVAINAPIQGSAADITKKAMVQTFQKFAGRDIHLVLQVHDSLVVECPAEEAETISKELVDVMEHAVSLSVPLRAEPKRGYSLAEV